MTGWRRELAGVVAALVGFLVGLYVAFAGVALLGDIDPPGGDCRHESVEASGPDGIGIESIEWLPVPHRVCVLEGHPASGGGELIDLAVAVVFGLVTAGTAGVLAERALGSAKPQGAVGAAGPDRAPSASDTSSL